MTLKLDMPVIGILRGISAEFFGPLMDAAFEAGLQAIEVTMNTAHATRIISACRDAVPPGKRLGAGTVRNLDEAKKAADAGAMFFVTPNLDISVIEYAGSRGIPVVAGAFTPTEVYTAWSAGADMVKVFPCRSMGPQYIKDLLGPFDRMALVAVGGVTLSNMAAYMEAGAEAVGVGASLFGAKALENRDIAALSRNVKNFIDQYREIIKEKEECSGQRSK